VCVSDVRDSRRAPVDEHVSRAGGAEAAGEAGLAQGEDCEDHGAAPVPVGRQGVPQGRRILRANREGGGGVLYTGPSRSPGRCPGQPDPARESQPDPVERHWCSSRRRIRRGHS
jgi:hypothetical protein